MHDVGLAAWFGGTLANAVSLNAAAGEAGDARETGAVAAMGWDRWSPVNAAAVGMHLTGSIGQLVGNRGRIGAQRGVAAMSVVKTALTAAAIGTTVYSRVLGMKLSSETDVPARSATEPDTSTPPKTAGVQRQLAVLQWVVPAMTGALVVVSSFASEQQRATEVHKGLMERFRSMIR